MAVDMLILARDRLGGCMVVDSGETGQGYTRRLYGCRQW